MFCILLCSLNVLVFFLLQPGYGDVGGMAYPQVGNDKLSRYCQNHFFLQIRSLNGVCYLFSGFLLTESPILDFCIR